MTNDARNCRLLTPLVGSGLKGGLYPAFGNRVSPQKDRGLPAPVQTFAVATTNRAHARHQHLTRTRRITAGQALRALVVFVSEEFFSRCPSSAMRRPSPSVAFTILP